jgi:hypothetical protein
MRMMILLLFILTAAGIYAQSQGSFDEIKKEYDAFEYRSVIKLSAGFLAGKDSVSRQALIDVYLMTAVSHYALAEETDAKNCFFEILKIDRNYQIDTEYYSPKIVDFFSRIKADYYMIVPEKKVETGQREKMAEVKKEPVLSNDILKLEEAENDLKTAFIKSVILPGWGHYDAQSYLKAAVLSTAALASYGGMAYYILETNKNEKNYLNETDENKIRTKYDEYNSSWKMRNIFIVSSIIIWAYSQLDLLFFDDNCFRKIDISIKPGQDNTGAFYLGLQASIPLK